MDHLEKFATKKLRKALLSNLKWNLLRLSYALIGVVHTCEFNSGAHSQSWTFVRLSRWTIADTIGVICHLDVPSGVVLHLNGWSNCLRKLKKEMHFEMIFQLLHSIITFLTSVYNGYCMKKCIASALWLIRKCKSWQNVGPIKTRPRMK